jgi:hypothetical protein
MAITHAGITSDDSTEIVADWIATARHPRSSTLYRARLFADAGVAEFSARRGKNWQRKYFSESLYGTQAYLAAQQRDLMKIADACFYLKTSQYETAYCG